MAASSSNAHVGPVPLLLCSGSFGSCLLTLQDRDVILVNDGNPSLSTFNPQTARYIAQQVQTTPAGPLSFKHEYPGSPGFCQSDTLTNETSGLASRIDLVLTHGASRVLDSHLMGNAPFQVTAPVWPSDHAGVVARVRLQ